MTQTRYLVARIGQIFGYVRRQYRLSEASAEMHLLREAEAYLGMMVWEHVEGVESLSMEYWNLRKLLKERDEVDRKVAECRERLNKSHNERAALLNGTPEQNDELMAERAACIERLETLARQRDQLVQQARDVRRIYMGTRTKLEVINEERQGKTMRVEDLNQIEDINARLVDIRKNFESLKHQRTEVGRLIEDAEQKLDLVDEKISALRQQRRERASEAFQVIGEMNKELAQLRAESGIMEARMRQLYSEIGRHISLAAKTDPKCAAAARPQQSLIDIMRALRKSVTLNQKLAGMDG